MKQATKNMLTAWTITIIDIILLEFILFVLSDIFTDNILIIPTDGCIYPKVGGVIFIFYLLSWIDPFCRMAIRNYCRLPRSYMLPSYILLIGFLPATFVNNNLFFTIIGAWVSVLSIIALPAFNIYYLIRARRESAFEPLPLDQAQDSPPPQSPVS